MIAEIRSGWLPPLRPSCHWVGACSGNHPTNGTTSVPAPHRRDFGGVARLREAALRLGLPTAEGRCWWSGAGVHLGWSRGLRAGGAPHDHGAGHVFSNRRDGAGGRGLGCTWVCSGAGGLAILPIVPAVVPRFRTGGTVLVVGGWGAP